MVDQVKDCREAQRVRLSSFVDEIGVWDGEEGDGEGDDEEG